MFTIPPESKFLNASMDTYVANYEKHRLAKAQEIYIQTDLQERLLAETLQVQQEICNG